MALTYQSMSGPKLHVHKVDKIAAAIFVLILATTQSIRAQRSATASQSVYEGQIVSAVDLVGNPRRDVDALRPLIAQRAGEPFSMASVEASLLALQQQGTFNNVRFETTSNGSGLQLNFILEPPYYVGIVQFPRIGKYFSYPQLLRVVEFSDQEPYNRSRLPRAEAALRQFLRNEGYFQAQVRAEPKIDDQSQLVNISFSVYLGERARIGTVDVHGASEQQNLSLLGILRSKRARLTGVQLKRGKWYSLELEKSTTAYLKKRLGQHHYLASKVQSTSEYDGASNVVDISFAIELGPVMNVRVTGARLSRIPFASGREAKKLIPIYSEHSLDQDLVEQGQRNLIDYFKKKKFFDVQVNTDFRHSPHNTSIIYAIQRGKKHKVAQIHLNGGHQIPQTELLSQVSVKKSGFWSRGRISDALLRQSADNLKTLYQDRGYENVKITWRTDDREPQLDVIFEIEEGPQTLVDQVLLTGNDHLSQEQLSGPQGLRLRPGMPFSSRRLANDRNRLSAAYLNSGYLTADVEGVVRRHANDPQQVDVTYAITEGQMVRVNQLAYLGQERTRVPVIAEATQIGLESPMKRGDLLAAESRVYGLNIFDWSSVGPKKPITTQGEEAALIKVHEGKRNEITYGFGFDVARRGGSVPSGSVAVPGIPPVSLEGHEIAPTEATYAGPRGSIEFSRRNMRGLAETASALLLISRLDQQVVLTYSQPRFAGSGWSSLTSFALERTTENPLYTAGLGNASFQVEHLLKPATNTRVQLRYNLNRTNLWDLLVPELVLPQDRNVRLSTVSGTLIRETRDKPLDARRGSFATLNLALTSTAIGATASFAKLFGQYATYKSAGPVVFANSVRLGLAKAVEGSFVPTSELFFSGGGTSLRSFPINQAGPQRIVPFCNVLQGESGCVDVTVPVGGRQLFIVNSEMRFPLGITKALGGVIFYDGGNVYRAINFNDFVRNYTNTVGFGVRYSTPIGPVRIDIGHNLNPVPGIHSTQYYITIGQAF